ncbi:MAG TPA: T9SS type A sorting domain-containing protein [Bacteroidia bacterium]
MKIFLSRCTKAAFVAFAFFLISNVQGQSITRLVGASPFQDSLWVFDTTNFVVIKRMAPTPSSGGSITGTNTITKHPVSGALYVVVKQSAQSGRSLGTIDLNTGMVSIIGNLGDNFSSLTFNGNNTLLGVTGDGASVPETVFRINTSTAATSLLRALGNGADGEIICYNPTDNMVYHWSGNGTIVYEKFDTSGVTVTNIPIIGTTNGETFGMVHLSGNTFIGSNISSRFQRWNANGTVGAQYGNSAPDDIRGTALITCQRSISGTLTFCAGDSTALTMSAGGTAYQWYMNGAVIPGATNQIYYARQAGWYNCRITDMCSLSSGDTLAAGVTVQQLSLPVVTLSGNNTICANDSTLLTGTSGGTSQWYFNGVAINGATSNTYYATAAGVYNMVKTNLNGCSDSAAAGITVTVNSLPVVTLSGNNTICAGDSTLLSSASSGTTQWYLNGTAINGATNNSYYASAPGVYNMTETNLNGCTDSAATGITVTVNPLPVVTYVESQTAACTNWPAFALTAGSPNGGTYSGTGVSGNMFDPSVSGAGTFNIVYSYTDGNGCSSSDTSTITVGLCTGTEQLSQNGFSVYPNPSGGQFTISTTGMADVVIITDVLGRELVQLKPSSKEVRIDLGDQKGGMYFVRIVTAGQQFTTRLIISK